MQTDAETKLWRYLRNRGIGGLKFRRQYPVGKYIVDFICLEARLVVEVDGGQHANEHEYDARRTRFLESVDLRVVRYWDDDVLLRTDHVLEHLLSQVATPHPSPLPASGERE